MEPDGVPADEQMQMVEAEPLQMVAAEEQGNLSPKRARMAAATVALPGGDEEFWRRIQETVT